MITLREAAQQALEALEHAGETGDWILAGPAITALRAALAEPDTCTWQQDEIGIWETGCGETHNIIDGTPKENGMRYCCYCGKEVKDE